MSSDTLTAGLRLGGRYTLVRPLGAGGMAAVWEAETDARERVAVKLLAPGLALDPTQVTRFKLEARVANRIGHQGVVRVIDDGDAPWGAPFLVMEHLVGATLEALLAYAGQLAPAQASAVMVPVLDALVAAHVAGVVHRDLKPANLFIATSPTPAVKLLDFGIAKAQFDGGNATRTGMAIGTPAYMAPEQARDAKSVGPQADVYSAGAVLFELLAGRPPFEGSNSLEVVARVLTERPPPLADLRPGLPSELTTLVDACLSQDPQARPAGAHVVREALRRLAPPDYEWPFTAVRALAPHREPSTALVPALAARPRQVEVSAARLLERLGPLRATEATRLVVQVLLSAQTPPVFGCANVQVARDGSARVTPGASSVVRWGARVRTTAAPEAWSARGSAVATQFSCGAVLYELLTGQALFEAADEAGLKRALERPVVGVLAGAPEALRDVVVRMVNPDPARRFAEPGACARSLEACFRGVEGWASSTEALGVLVGDALRSPATATAPRAAASGGVRAFGWGAFLVLAVLAGVSLWPKRIVGPAPPAPPPVELVEPTHEAAPPVELPADVNEVDLTHKPPDVYTVRSTPAGVALWVDGEFRGPANGELQLPVGKTWTLELRAPGHRTRTEHITPVGGERRTLDLSLDPTGVPLGTLQVNAPDDAQVLLDGVPVGLGNSQVPLEADVAHVVQVQTPRGRTSPREVTVPIGQTRLLEFDVR